MNGEIGAVSGYYHQYNLASWEIYFHILEEDLQSITLASEDAGKLDDVLLELNDKVVAYQVKNKSGNFTYNALVNPNDSLIQGLFQGWQKLKKKYPTKQIDAKLISTQSISTADKILAYNDNNKPSFKLFIEDFWNKIRKNNKIGKKWEGVKKELQSILSCNSMELMSFISDTHLSFDYRTPNKSDYSPLKWEIVNNDINTITNYIFSVLGTEKRTIRFTKEDFINKIGLDRRLKTYFNHDFFIDEKHYIPIENTIDKLNKLIASKRNGYIIITGSAGSGKSTLLTKWISENENHVIRYYAYVNSDMSYKDGYRGESHYFLHDIIHQIKAKKLWRNKEILPEDIIGLKSYLSDELENLSKEYKETGRRTYILVDGLDHIEREQKVQYSLIKELPLPNSIPDGVYFILGTRSITTLKNLSDSIKVNVDSHDRNIEMSGMSQSKVSEFVRSYDDINLTENQLSILFNNSNGHPLFLRYAIEKLLQSDPKIYSDIVSSNTYTGDINDEYKKHWITVNTDDEYKKLLGIISRFRYSFVEIRLLEDAFDFSDSLLSKLLTTAGHFFYKNDISKWQFFHNSFKWFLEEKTAQKTISGTFDDNKDKEFHALIAKKIKNTSSTYKWNIIYHLFRSDQFEEIVELAKQEYFRKQWYSYRNDRDILEDISIASKAAYEQNNFIGIVRAYFADAELRQRLFDFDPSLQYEIFTSIGMDEVADSYIYNGKEILVQKIIALDYVRHLITKDYLVKAKKIFDLAEPTYILYHSKVVDRHRYSQKDYREIDECKLLIKWAEVAINFYDFEKISSLLKDITVIDSNYNNYKFENFIYECIDAIINSYKVKKAWETILVAIKFLENTVDSNGIVFTICLDIAWDESFDDKICEYCIDKCFEIGANSSNNNVILELALLSIVFKRDIKKASHFFKELKPPNQIEDNTVERKHIYTYLRQYCILLFATTEDFSFDYTQLFPKADSQDELFVYRVLCELGLLRAKLIHKRVEESSLLQLLKTILSFYHKKYNQIDYTVRNKKSELVEIILNIGRNYSNELFELSFNTLVNDWRRNITYWNSSEIREIIHFGKEYGIPLDNLKKELVSLGDNMLLHKYRAERCEECIEHSKSWLLFNDTIEGKRWLENAYKESIGIRGEKDHQFSRLMKWQKVLSKHDPDNTTNRIAWVLGKLKFIQNTTSHEQYNAAINSLEVSFVHNKSHALKIAKWLLKSRLVNLCDILDALLSCLLLEDEGNIIIYSKIMVRLVLQLQDSGNYGYSFSKKMIDAKPSIEFVRYLINEIEIYGIDENKNRLIRHIIEYSNSININTGLTIEDYPVYDSSSSGSLSKETLTLTSGENFSEVQVLDMVTDFKSLKELMNDEREYSRFNWANAINKIQANLNRENIVELIDLKNFEGETLYAIINLCLNNHKDLAKEIIYDSIERGRANDWITFYSGGTRLKLFNLLLQVEDRTIVSDFILKDLAYSIKEIDTKTLITEEIWPILDLIYNGDAPFTEIYAEVDNYQKELLNTSTYDETTPELQDSEMSVIDFTLEILLYIYQLPISTIREHVIKIIIECNKTNPKITDGFLRLLFKSSLYSEFVRILDALVIKDINTCFKFITELQALVTNETYDISELAKSLLNKINVEYRVSSIDTQLPSVYSLELPYSPELIVDDDIKSQRLEDRRSLRETNDPIEFAGFYMNDVEILARESGLSKINIAYRLMSLALKVKLPDLINGMNEYEIRGFLSAIDLELSYIRPRMLQIWPALMTVVKELHQAGRISEPTANFISKRNDPVSFYIPVNKRPKSINCIEDVDKRLSLHKSIYNSEWVENADRDLFKSFLNKINEDYVLAEYSILQSHKDGRASEIRQSCISFYCEEVTSSWGIFSDKIFNCFINEYPEESSDDIVMYNRCFSTNNIDKWIAINPKICQELNWILSDSENFEWRNRKGDVMVKSLFWNDGNIGNYNRLIHSESGIGWIVVASKKGYDEIKKMSDGILYRHMKGIRKYKEAEKDHYIITTINND